MIAPEHLAPSTQHLAPGTRVKICGVRDTVNAFAAADAGADLIGFVFAPSKRRIGPDDAAAIIAALRQRYGAKAPLAVGLFVNEEPARMREIAAACRLDLVQLSGDEAPDAALLAAIGLPVIRFLRVPIGSPASEVLDQVARWHAAAQEDGVTGPWGTRLLIGLDAYHAASYGGTGQTADHALAAALARQYPLMLAGGLNPANVSEAIAGVQPWAVDVSSGVEQDGAKSPALIAAFLAAAKGSL
jgi:phosphoribosylanthranilate isomerase